MLRAFFDESTDDAKVFLMAGWLGSVEVWERFSAAWASELSGNPSISYFKHNEAISLKGKFGSWSEKERDTKLLSLAQVIARYELTGFIGGVSLHRFKSFFSGSIIPRKVLRSIVTFTEPYHFCCNCVIAQTLGHQIETVKNPVDTVDFIFDDGVPFLDDCITNYAELKKVLPEKAQMIAGTVKQGNDRDIVALQAADMLAGQALLNLRIGKKPAPLDAMRTRTIFLFHCLPNDPESIPRSISIANVVWSTKLLDRAKQKLS
jgi:hypothetical protein